MRPRRFARATAFACVVALSACGNAGGTPEPEPTPASASASAASTSSPPSVAAPPTVDATAAATPAMARAKELFAQRCSTCHGPAGDGQGLAAAGLTVKPRNYTDRAWQASTTDALIEKVILEGGPSIGKSPLMPPNPDLADAPEVVTALRVIVRDFGAK